MASPKTKSDGALFLAKKHQQSISPHRKSCSSGISSSSSVNESPVSSFSYPNRIIIHRNYASPSPAAKFSIDQRTGSPASSVTSSSPKDRNQSANGQKKTCMCSPTTHPGSFRCSFHKKLSNMNDNRSNSMAAAYHTHRLYVWRSAMTNSLVRIGSVEGDLLKRALASLIRPSSHQQRRRGDFQPRPSRLSVMSKAGN